MPVTVSDLAADPAAARTAARRALATERFDLLVVGGGVTGCGVARDAALRGLRVALVEREDFASGTSSRSSRLVHGGVRYLEQGALGLVFEASAERRRLLRLAPHLVRPLRFTWPVYAGARVAGWKLAAGLTLYDLLALFRNVGAHERLRAEAVLAREPALRREGLQGGATYWDAETDDSRLTLATALDAARAGAVLLNHAAVTGLHHRASRVSGAQVKDCLTDDRIDVHARVVVNATGPWSDGVRGLDRVLDRPGAAIRGSKGVHVAVPRERIGNVGALTLLAPRDGRVFFVLPSGDQAIIGTTDTDTDVAPEEVRASRSDVAYLLNAANAYFPGARLTEADVVSAWAGVRPLAARPRAHERSPSSASREHSIVVASSGLVSVTGGKLTTYRSMAAEVTAVVERALGRRARPSPTIDRPLPGGDLADREAAEREAAEETGEEDLGRRLVQAHGSEWRAVWAACAGSPDGRERLTPDRPYLVGELRWGVEREMARTLGDLLIRRTRLAFETRDHGVAVAESAAAVVAPLLGWDAARRALEVHRYEREVERMFRVEG